MLIKLYKLCPTCQGKKEYDDSDPNLNEYENHVRHLGIKKCDECDEHGLIFVGTKELRKALFGEDLTK